jgi:NTE family protein
MLRHQLRASLSAFLDSLPADLQDNPVTQRLRAFAHPKTVDIVHLIYRPAVPQGSTKDFQFVRGAIDQRWTQGRHDAHVTMQAAPWNSAPGNSTPGKSGPVRVFDVLAAGQR